LVLSDWQLSVKKVLTVNGVKCLEIRRSLLEVFLLLSAQSRPQVAMLFAAAGLGEKQADAKR
jgi:hypothetical protein